MAKASRDALQAKGKVDVYMMDPDKVVLVENEKSPLYDERVKAPFKEELVQNILYMPDGATPQGILEPVIGRRNNENGDIEIVIGRKRTKALREANRRLVKQGAPPLRLPVWIRRSNDSRALAALISENELRDEDTPQNRARKAQRLKDLGHADDEIAKVLGTSEATVKNMLRALDAPAVVRAAWDAGKISVSDGYRLSKLEPAEAKKKLNELLKQAPRTPGKKRSQNAKKARAIMGRGGAGGGGATPVPNPGAKDARKLEDAIAEAIADWIQATWSEGDWGGAPKEIPNRIRAGEWREKKPEKEPDDGEE
jgi:ParB family transcriptional regulator, chromosome partitioning protein